MSNNDNSSFVINEKEKNLGLYIHIPFCAKKCDYCDFLSAPATEGTISKYFNAMLIEIEQYRNHTTGYIVPTIFFGGGTPSVVDAVFIEKIMNSINEIFHIDFEQLEATIEVNPGTVTREKLQIYKNIGINRLSFGLQSANNSELQLLGRIHTFEQFKENYNLARELGFQNINIDLMSALPGQTLESWEHTLQTVIGLNPEHISAYSLIIEEGTKFYDRYHENAAEYKDLPDEETDRQIYHRTKEILRDHGYDRYEISNYAKSSYESRHNSSYWRGTDYLGIGLGASSLLNGARFSNMHDIECYIAECNDAKFKINNTENSNENNVDNEKCKLEDYVGIRVNKEILSLKQRMEEFMFLGLRMCSGISKMDFFQRFGVEIDSVYKEILNKFKNEKLLEINGDNVRLTDLGIDISNYVLAEFLLD